MALGRDRIPRRKGEQKNGKMCAAGSQYSCAECNIAGKDCCTDLIFFALV
jgi:hypothetical protein